MRINKYVCILLAVILASGLLVGMTVAFGDSRPVMLGAIPDPDETVALFFDSLCEGDYAKCDEYIYGYSSLGLDRPAETETGRVLIGAVLDSLSFEQTEKAVTDGTHAHAAVRLTCLDVSKVVGPVKALAGERLSEMVKSATSNDQIYQEDGNYREDVVMQVLSEALETVLSEPERYYSERDVEIELEYSGGKWLVVLNDSLLNAISGNLS